MQISSRAMHWALVIPLAAGCSGPAATRSGSAIEIAPGVAQLFVDDALIEHQSHLKRTLHQPRKELNGDTALIPANPGTSLLAYGSIVFDEHLRKYVMFLQDFETRRMLRTTSDNGLDWDARTQDELQEVHFDLDLKDIPPELQKRFGIDLFSCYYDRSDAQFPYKGWLWLANCGNDLEGIFYFRSPDGLKWQRVRQVVQGFADETDTSCRRFELPDRTLYGPGDVTLFSYDAPSKRFLGIFKFFDPRKGISNGSRSRAYVWLDRIDEPVEISRIGRVALLPPLADREGDTKFDEYYASTAWRYGSHWLGGLKIYHGQGDYPYSAAGCAFLKLVSSRDALHWKKVPFANDAGVPEVFIPNATQGGNDGRNDGGYLSEFSQGPLRVGDELIYYYCCSSYGKNAPKPQRLGGGGLFRARLRLDGFVSVEGGRLTTVPLKSAGQTLSINARGPVAVELLGEDGRSRGQAEISGDSLHHNVLFSGKSLKAVLPSGSFRLRFEVGDGGRLYSFTLR